MRGFLILIWMESFDESQSEKVYTVTVSKKELKMPYKQMMNLAIECFSYDAEINNETVRLFFVEKKHAEIFVAFVFSQEKMIRSRKKK